MLPFFVRALRRRRFFMRAQRALRRRRFLVRARCTPRRRRSAITTVVRWVLAHTTLGMIDASITLFTDRQVNANCAAWFTQVRGGTNTGTH